LLGFDGNVIACHGRSDVKAIENAILKTDYYLKCGVLDKIREAVKEKKLY
jgi:phosphate acyltransferase